MVALVITTDATKVPVGLWLGDTENTTVVTGLLADLVARGLACENGLLVVIDGAKALAAGVAKVFGDAARVQRCTLHYGEAGIMWTGGLAALVSEGLGLRESA